MKTEIGRRFDVIYKCRRRLFASHAPGSIPVLGVDPGMNGGFAIVDPDGAAEAVKMPRTVDGKEIDYAVLAAFFADLRMHGVCQAYVEGVVKYDGLPQTGASGFVYGPIFGIELHKNAMFVVDEEVQRV